jgi:hypothetical protein
MRAPADAPFLTMQLRYRWEKVLLQRLEDAQRELMSADRALLRIASQLQHADENDPGIKRVLERAKSVHSAAYEKCKTALTDFNGLVMYDQLPEGEHSLPVGGAFPTSL